MLPSISLIEEAESRLSSKKQKLHQKTLALYNNGRIYEKALPHLS